MDTRKHKILGKLILITMLFSTVIYAKNVKLNIKTMGVKAEVAHIASISTPYQSMSTQELEKEVERMTISGNVPFEMGVELMKRWTKG